MNPINGNMSNPMIADLNKIRTSSIIGLYDSNKLNNSLLALGSKRKCLFRRAPTRQVKEPILETVDHGSLIWHSHRQKIQVPRTLSPPQAKTYQIKSRGRGGIITIEKTWVFYFSGKRGGWTS